MNFKFCQLLFLQLLSRTVKSVIFHFLVFSRSVISNSLQLYGLQPTRLLCPWNFLGKNTGSGCHFLLQGILPNPGIKHTSLASPGLAGGFFTIVPSESLSCRLTSQLATISQMLAEDVRLRSESKDHFTHDTESSRNIIIFVSGSLGSRSHGKTRNGSRQTPVQAVGCIPRKEPRAQGMQIL